MKGSEFIEQIRGLSRADREAAILAAVDAGAAVAWDWVDVTIAAGTRDVTLHVASDYFAIGEADDFVRMPCDAFTAQSVADKLGAVLPTTKLVDAIWHAANMRLVPVLFTPPLGPDGKPHWDNTWCEYMMSVEALEKHNQRVEAQLAISGRVGLVSGCKKDIVNTTRLALRPKQVAIYGWPELNGKPIQPLSLVHESTYRDFSHGVRLIRNDCLLDGEERSLAELAMDPVLHVLVSNEGPVVLRHPGVPARVEVPFSVNKPQPKGRSFADAQLLQPLSCFDAVPLGGKNAPQAEPMASNGFSKSSRH